MNDHGERAVATVVVLSILGGIGAIGGVLGYSIATRNAQQQAVDAGAAVWRADQATGVVTFEWKKSD